MKLYCIYWPSADSVTETDMYTDPSRLVESFEPEDLPEGVTPEMAAEELVERARSIGDEKDEGFVLYGNAVFVTEV